MAVEKCAPMSVGAFSFLWSAAALLPLFFCTGGACHALRLRSLRVVHFVAPASCRHFSFHFVAPASCRHLSFLRDLCALVSALSVLSLCLLFCCSLSAVRLNFFF